MKKKEYGVEIKWKNGKPAGYYTFPSKSARDKYILYAIKHQSHEVTFWIN